MEVELVEVKPLLLPTEIDEGDFTAVSYTHLQRLHRLLPAEPVEQIALA